MFIERNDVNLWIFSTDICTDSTVCMYYEEMCSASATEQALIVSNVSCEFVFKAVHAYIISIHSDLVVYACWIEVYCHLNV